jgi:hypothetical protein
MANDAPGVTGGSGPASEPARARGVVELPHAGVPADHGLSSLGLLMQLGGGLAACGGLLALLALLAVRELSGATPDGAGWEIAAAGLCVARSLAHRAAGTELLYGGRKRPDGSAASPLDGVRRYVAIALVQTVLLALVCHAKLGVSGPHVLACSAGLALWPLVLAGILASGALARLEPAIPYGEDKGFEGAAILMAVLGASGALATGAILVAELRGATDALFGAGTIVVGALVLLLVRSCLHVRAGLGGLRETSVDRTVELASCYAGFGVVSSLWFGGVMLLAAMSSRMGMWGMAVVATLCWLMTMWPLIVRRFFSDRQIAELLAGDPASLHRRAPDAGLSGLGWLLVGHAVLTASLLVPQLLAGPEVAGGARWLASLGAGIGDGSPWWSAGVVVLEAWAGTELLRMGAHHRLLAIVYGAAATLVTLSVMGTTLERAMELRVLERRGEELVLPLALIAIQLAIPVSAVLLATRTVSPTARARYRRDARGVRAP